MAGIVLLAAAMVSMDQGPVELESRSQMQAQMRAAAQVHWLSPEALMRCATLTWAVVLRARGHGLLKHSAMQDSPRSMCRSWRLSVRSLPCSAVVSLLHCQHAMRVWCCYLLSCGCLPPSETGD